MWKWLKRGALTLLILIALAVGTGWWLLRGSLPALDGELALPGLSAPVELERDALGTVTIKAANETDAMRALGYVHAQERFFEMDLMRRSAAGELSALFGPIALKLDKDARVHRFRARTLENLDAFAGDKLPQLQAYRDGVNAGLANLKVRPWPYLLLRTEPQPWQLADSALTGYAMFFDLQDGKNERELALWRIRQVVPTTLYRLIDAEGTEWDAPLMGAPRGNVALPGPDELDLRKLPAAKIDLASLPPEQPAIGSNSFAVAGALTQDGRAIVADDMHLGLRAPNLWFRARLQYVDPRAPDGKVDVTGVTLPGIPGVIVGSNGHVAWGFTNSYGDWLDWARFRYADDTRGTYPARGANLPVRRHEEIIEVAGDDPVRFEVRETFWGPILREEGDGSFLALRWSAHLRGALNLELAGLARARDLQQAVPAIAKIGLPAQNLLIGDARGQVAWKLVGRLPQRDRGCDVLSPVAPMLRVPEPPPSSPADENKVCAAWTHWRSDTPDLIDPSSQRLWTANARVADGEVLRLIGDGGYDLGARQKQIHDALFAKQRFTEKELLAIQLDDRALLMERWWTLLREVVTKQDDDDALQALAEASALWDGHASVDSASYRIARAFREQVLDAVTAGLLAPAKAKLGKEFVMPKLRQREGVVWELVTQRPAHLLPRGVASWDTLLADAARRVHADLAKQGGDLADRTWGERNTTAICHPLAGALPAFARPLLCMPAEPLPGDSNMPRVQGPEVGASERMVVSPGHEKDGIFHMPGGQSGHPLSPFWAAGHDDWAKGRPTPFLPGPARHRLRMAPAP